MTLVNFLRATTQYTVLRTDIHTSSAADTLLRQDPVSCFFYGYFSISLVVIIKSPFIRTITVGTGIAPVLLPLADYTASTVFTPDKALQSRIRFRLFPVHL